MNITSFYVQGQDKNGMPETIWHSKDGYQFLDKKKAEELLAAEKKLRPEEKFRIVKLTESYKADKWV